MTVQIFNLDQINSFLKDLGPIQSIEDGFVAYSQGKVNVPPSVLLKAKSPLMSFNPSL